MQTRLVAGRYELTRELGQGGMGTVWLGKDCLTGRTVAVKELRAPAGTDARDREVFGKRALREASNAARIQHPNAVTLYDVVPQGADDDAVYLVMEYVNGMTLAQEIHRNGRLDEDRVTAIAIQLLSVLEAAHGLGVIHRDIKPGNIMISPAGQVKLADFGIAHTVGDTRLTSSGAIGTAAYMAPEQFEAQPVTAASDLWSLGATLYHASEGRGPFDRESTAAILRSIVMGPVPATHFDGPLAAVIAGLLTRDPARRLTIPQARQMLNADPATHPATAPAGQPLQEAADETQRRHLRGIGLKRALGVTGTDPGPGAVRFTSRLGSVARVPALSIGPLGILVYNSRHSGLFIKWNEITRIGPVTKDGTTYLYAWAEGISRKRPLVRLCRLGSPHFPPADIRAAILRHHPDAVIDPM